MKPKIAVVTVDGRAYYELVNELQRKKLPLLSLKPWDPVPLNIKAVLTTKEESSQIEHPKILLFDQKINPESVVNEAFLIVQGKKRFEKIVIGIDPGNSCGIAIIGDNKILDTLATSNIEKTFKIIVDSLKQFPADIRLIRIGDGIPEYTKILLSYLNDNLPRDVFVEIVSRLGLVESLIIL
jgi:hypothetical protein